MLARSPSFTFRGEAGGLRNLAPRPCRPCAKVSISPG